MRTIQWNLDGSIAWQTTRGTWPFWQLVFLASHEFTTESPWLWGVTDQTEPTMPEWMKDDAQWQAALDAQE